MLAEHPLSLGIRGFIDLSRISTPTPPGVEYVTAFVSAVQPLLAAAYHARCAVLVSSQPLLWRARLVESMTSGSRICFRAFRDRSAALAWLHIEPSR